MTQRWIKSSSGLVTGTPLVGRQALHRHSPGRRDPEDNDPVCAMRESRQRCLSSLPTGHPHSWAAVGRRRWHAIATARLLETAAELPRHHADPFDRVLIAHALQDDLSVLTRDVAFEEYGVRVAPMSL
jgi:hypothetical protein